MVFELLVAQTPHARHMSSINPLSQVLGKRGTKVLASCVSVPPRTVRDVAPESRLARPAFASAGLTSMLHLPFLRLKKIELGFSISGAAMPEKGRRWAMASRIARAA